MSHEQGPVEREYKLSLSRRLKNPRRVSEANMPRVAVLFRRPQSGRDCTKCRCANLTIYATKQRRMEHAGLVKPIRCDGRGRSIWRCDVLPAPPCAALMLEHALQ
jgi:hypothetical protein